MAETFVFYAYDQAHWAMVGISASFAFGEQGVRAARDGGRFYISVHLSEVPAEDADRLRVVLAHLGSPAADLRFDDIPGTDKLAGTPKVIAEVMQSQWGSSDG